MKTFQFSLDQVLALRKEEEEEAEVNLGRVMSEWNSLRSRQKDCDAVFKNGQVSSGRQGDDLFQASLYLARVGQQKKHFAEQMKALEPRLSELRKLYMEARARREGLEKLRESRLKEHKKKQAQQEAYALDDLSMNMARQLAEQE